MNNNRKFILIATLYCALLLFFLFQILGWAGFYLVEILFGKSQGLMAFRYAYFAVLISILSIPLSWLIYFLTIGKIYKKLGANFNFKHPVLFTSIIIFVLGNILFYLAMLAWFAVK